MSVKELKAREIDTPHFDAMVIGGKARFFMEIHSDDGEESIDTIREARDFLDDVLHAMEETQ